MAAFYKTDRLYIPYIPADISFFYVLFQNQFLSFKFFQFKLLYDYYFIQIIYKYL